MMLQAIGVIIASGVLIIDMNPWTVLAGRFLMGLFAGIGPLVVSKYIEESCPLKVKA